MEELTMEKLTFEAINDYYQNLPEEIKKSLTLFLTKITFKNKEHNITGIKDQQVLFEKFILESLIPLCLGLKLSDKELLDIGSGAGIPGIVLAIADPCSKVTSLDKSPVKIKFQSQVKKSLSLANLTTNCAKLEDISPSCKYDYVLARAYKASNIILPQAYELLPDNGHLLLWKGQNWDKEWQDTSLRIKQKYDIIKIVRYDISIHTGGIFLSLERKTNHL
ncbi:MAG: 16S rRNA (guanine(527)-N(7))-methyltransferase RsmG [SAR324 cluster bacterium]|nr:16S rRNA (guanine(527)-N(7))-methyltransferase RsmG [SAR324 cluster bacterium]